MAQPIASQTIPNSVTSIGQYAFSGCSSLTSITIPNSVTSIGEYAFYWCSGLTSVTIPNSVTGIGNNAFRDVNNIIYSGTATGSPWGAKCVNGYVDGYLVYSDDTKTTLLGCSAAAKGDIVIPNSVTSIGDGAFLYCSGLTSVTIPNSVTSIGSSAFFSCSSLTSVTIPNSVTSIGKDAFRGCSSLTSVTIPNSVTSIGNSAFEGCSSLTSIEIPNSVTSIGSSAFSGCSGLTSLTIPNGVTSIGSFTFNGCSSLTSVTIGNSVTSIGSSAFSGCSSLTSVTIPNSVTSIGYSAFAGCSSLTSVTIPNSVTSIEDGAFYKCSSLTSVTIPNSVTSIGQYAFSGCSSLTSITIPNSVTSIGNSAFSSCSRLTSVTIPNSVTSIGNSAFSSCSRLTSIYVPCGEMERFKQMLNNDSRINDHAPLPYTITINAINGTVAYPQTTCDDMQLTATPYNGYHFVKWSDGNTDNPRTIELTCDTIFTALFEYNQCTLSLQCDENQGTVEGAGVFDYLAEVQISATPAYGYHFSSWSDGNTANPRTITITKDIALTANFALNKYALNVSCNAEQGSVSGSGSYNYLSNRTIEAIPNYGYHFTQWSDGNTDNPRTFVLAKDTTFTAQFAPNQYTLSLQCDDNQGSVEGAGVFDYLAEVQISATPAYGYHFSSWSDGNTDNPRTITLTKDVTLTANFAPNTYTLNVSCNAEQGSVTGSGSYNYLSNRTIEATSNYGYHFKQWSDGNTDNPRTIELRQDTTLEAIFAVDKYGTCGDNLQLTWRYDTGNQTLTISGEGDLTTNMRYGVEAVKEMKELVIEDGVGVIGNEAFANIKTLNTITLGKDVRKLQERVFYNCYNLTAIYNYRKTPASATSNTFEEVDKYACTIYVLAGSEEMFRSATGWKDFYSILTIGATETTVSDNKVSVEPSDNSATVTWPVSNEAASYTIDITKDGVVFCRLTFNANGQLTGIAFAPGRDGQSMAPAAVMTANGLQFTVTGLDSNTQYGYSLTAKDANEQPIATYSGSFTTTSEGVPTGIDNTPFLSGEGSGEASKILRNGEVLILRDGKTYTLQGIEVR